MSKPSYQIRLARWADCENIQGLIKESSREIGLEDYTPEQIEGALEAAWGLDTQLVKDNSYFVVEYRGELVACGGWSFRQTLFGNDAETDRDPAVIDPLNGAAKIRAFFVKPSHKRRGLGSMIMLACEEAAQSKGYTTLELMATLPGQRLYARHGFVAGEAIEYPLGAGLTIQFLPMTKTLRP